MLATLFQQQQRKYRYWLLGLGLALLVAMLLSLQLGAVGVGIEALWQPVSRLEQQVFWQLRLPRTLLAVLVGASLALCGAVLQVLLHNPLAEPGLIGISSGASLAAVLTLSLSVHLGLSLPYWSLSLAAFVGALLVTLLLLALARRRLGPGALLLFGVAVGILANAVLTWLLYLADDASLRSFLFWMMGSLGHGQPLSLWLPALVTLVWLVTQGRRLDMLALGDNQARLLGLNVRWLQPRLVLAVCLLTAFSVAMAGPIGFVGLVVPHLLRLLVGGKQRFLLPASMLAGAMVLTLADVAARTVLTVGELPIGAVTATLGAPVFIWLLVRRHAGA
ncbi:vitamin B12 ABC transporter permease BtuC [Oceanisphaera psychrotolerans]|uniref:Vitamin B12 ABC transporter permease BtuC n=1 Tax=Oceanisphaera psychrotolerans TaxID=1414654 RepID=A0A1J4QFK6_9GAMM|nr:vitamin B12 ABC transporter permease BtuC [Oceanisphaera psychrotolerans]OIN12784.1 vitamin B12 ABC transporter permease BtuC [Oceanisphaera psychrotolerans]